MLKASHDELERLPEAEGQGQEHEDVDGTFESAADERNGEDLHRTPQYD